MELRPADFVRPGAAKGVAGEFSVPRFATPGLLGKPVPQRLRPVAVYEVIAVIQ